MKDILEQIFSLLSSKQKRNGMGMVMLLVFYSFLDFFSIAFFLPAILVAVQPAVIQKNILLHKIYEGFDFLNAQQFAITLIAVLFILILAKMWINQWITFRKASFAYDISRDLAVRVVDSYFNRSYEEFTHVDFSKEVNRMVSAPLAFANNILIPAGTLFSEFIVLVMILGATSIFDVKAFALVCVMLVPAWLIYSRRKTTAATISAKLGKYYPYLLKRGFEIAEGQVDIRSFQKQRHFRQRFIDAHEELDKTLVADHTTQTGTARVTEIVGAACICAMMLYAFAARISSDEIVVLLGIYATATFRAIPSVNRILASLHQIRVNRHIVDSLCEIKAPISKDGTVDLTFERDIVLNNLSFRYADQTQLINAVTLQIQKGEKIALTGPSGNGKTTILMLLLGYLHPAAGHVLIDGRILNGTTEAAWRKQIGYVPQRPYILDGTIASNIAFGELSPDLKKIESLICDVELEQWISTLPNGIHTPIGERGVKVSGGQLQRISIARALYKNPAVLVLDEVTNQLDPATEAGIFQSLLKIAAGKTLVMITHNHDILDRFDRRIEIKDGQLIDRLQES